MYDAFSTADYALLRLAMEKRVLERIKKASSGNVDIYQSKNARMKKGMKEKHRKMGTSPKLLIFIYR